MANIGDPAAQMTAALEDIKDIHKVINGPLKEAIEAAQSKFMGAAKGTKRNTSQVGGAFQQLLSEANNFHPNIQVLLTICENFIQQT